MYSNNIISPHIAINETKKAMLEQKKGWLKGSLKLVAFAVGCAFGTWAIQKVLVSLGAAAKFSLAACAPPSAKAVATSHIMTMGSSKGLHGTLTFLF